MFIYCLWMLNRGTSSLWRLNLHSFPLSIPWSRSLLKLNFTSYLRVLIVVFNVSSCRFQNIELKVEVESLKKELEEKQQFLDKALWVRLLLRFRETWVRNCKKKTLLLSLVWLFPMSPQIRGSGTLSRGHGGLSSHASPLACRLT